MQLSDFIDFVYLLCGAEDEKAEFIRKLVDNFMETPPSEAEYEKEANDNYNPVAPLSISTLKSIANGTRTISKGNARRILSHMDKGRFSEFIDLNLSSNDNITSLCEKISHVVPVSVNVTNLSEICADIFESILQSIVASHKSIPEPENPLINQGDLQRIRILTSIDGRSPVSNYELGISPEAFYQLVIAMADDDLIVNIPDPVLLGSKIVSFSVDGAIITKHGKKLLDSQSVESNENRRV